MQKVLQTLAMPADLNAYGIIFGGWIMGQIDIAGAIIAREYAARVLTVTAENIRFEAPIYAGELVSAEAELIATGTSSIKVRVQLLTRRADGEQVVAAQAVMVYVSVDERGQKLALK